MSAGRIPTTANSPLTAKGDLFGYSTQPARLAVGANGDTIVADSSTATGLKWAAPVGGGKVLQVVSATHATQTQVTNTTYGDSGLTLTITPTSATSKILVMVNQTLRANTSSGVGTGAAVRIVRGATSIYNPNSGFYNIHYFEVPSAGYRELYDIKALTFLDSPATTAATTYKTQIAGLNATNTATAQADSAVSVITLLEIGA